MPYNSFPNAEELFGSAYALDYPVPELLRLIETHPTYATVTDLLDCYIDIVQQNPYRANELAFWLSYLSESQGALTIGFDSFGGVFNRALADRHCFGFRQNQDTGTFGPTNTHLTTSLLSGLSLRHKLTDCSDQYGNIEDGLNVVDNNSPISEVLVIGACIQLLIDGSEIVPNGKQYFQSEDVVAAKLKTQKALGTVKNSNALKVLELAISHAETGFKRENDNEYVWEILFPSQA